MRALTFVVISSMLVLGAGCDFTTRTLEEYDLSLDATGIKHLNLAFAASDLAIFGSAEATTIEVHSELIASYNVHGEDTLARSEYQIELAADGENEARLLSDASNCPWGYSAQVTVEVPLGLKVFVADTTGNIWVEITPTEEGSAFYDPYMHDMGW